MKGKEGWILVILFLTLLIPPIIVIIAEVSKDVSYNKIDKYSLSSSSKPLRFHVLGDFGNLKSEVIIEDKEPVNLVAHAMKTQAIKRPIDFILSAGDNSYPMAYAKFDQHIYKLMYDVFQKEAIKAKPWYLVLGNHDCYVNPDYEVKDNKLYPMWNMPSRYYSFVKEIDDSKKVGFTFLDGCALTGQGVTYSNSSATKQYEWLIDELSKQKSDKSIVWKIVTIHMPLWSPGEGHGDNDILKEYLYPILYEYGVDLVIAGHDHIMAHYASRIINNKPQPFKPKNENFDCGNYSFFPYNQQSDWFQGEAIYELLQGASGRELYNNCPYSTTTMADLLFTVSEYGFTEVYIDHTKIQIDYFDLFNDLPIYTTRIFRN